MSALGYQQIINPASATGLTVPMGATSALIAVSGGAIRWRDDGTSPTASHGMPVVEGQTFLYGEALSAIEFINQAGSVATLDVSYYD